MKKITVLMILAAALAVGGIVWFKRQGRDPIVFWISLSVIAFVAAAHALHWQAVMENAAAATQLALGVGMAASGAEMPTAT